MILSAAQTVRIILVVAACTFLTRLLPFAVFGRKKEVPKLIGYLGKILPPAMIATLVIYCVKNISFLSGSRGIPELLSIAVVAGLHLWKRNTLLSIGLGTLCYMVLVQAVF